MPRRPSRPALLALAGGLIGIVGLAFVARSVYTQRSELGDALADASVGWLAVAWACGLAGMVAIGVLWILIARHSGGVVPAGKGMRWFFVGQLGKYVPGGVWPVVGTGELAVRGGVDRPTAYSSTIVSMFATYAAAVMVGGLAALPFGGWYTVLGAGALVGTAVGLWLVGHGRVARLLARAKLRLPARRELVGQVARHGAVWVLMGLATWCTIHAIGGTVNPVRVVAMTALAWTAGFVIVGVPGGIGVRESIFIALLSGPLGEGDATAVALVARLVSILADLSGALLTVVVLPTSTRSGRGGTNGGAV